MFPPIFVVRSGREGHGPVRSLDLRAMHDASRCALELIAAMHGRAVVPHHEVAELPDVLVDEAPLYGVCPQLRQEGVGLFARMALDIGVAPPAEVERRAAVARMAQDRRMPRPGCGPG